ncbi:MAG: hypothetical protein V1814_02345 [Candidatus Moraniibacteriota bacterium]
MKHKIKKIFENAVWWSGVAMIGLILGLSLQFVRAWTEPTQAPPGGNVGAPINTSAITQIKNGVLGVLGLSTSYVNVPGVIPAAGNVLTAQNASGQVAWAAAGGGGGCYVDYSLARSLPVGSPCKVNGFTIRGSAGLFGLCGGYSYCGSECTYLTYFSPAGGGCSAWGSLRDSGEAYVCCQ